jgi:hypothetical protein
MTPALVPTHSWSLHASKAVIRKHAVLCCRMMSSAPLKTSTSFQSNWMQPVLTRAWNYRKQRTTKIANLSLIAAQQSVVMDDLSNLLLFAFPFKTEMH